MKKNKVLFTIRKKPTGFYNFFILFLKLFIPLIFLWLFMLFLIPRYGRNQTEKTTEKIFKKNPDLIVAYTGGVGRITYAVDKSFEWQTPLFISGVDPQNSTRHVLKTRGRDIILQRDPTLIEIEQVSHNTIENVLSTLSYLEKHPEFKRVLIVSSDYHILRIRMIFYKLLKEKNQEFYFTGIPTDYNDKLSVRLMLLEPFKILRSLFILLLWD
ncbi:MAG: YdcF family protein [Bacteriovoracaceae bacterium]|nr:YdcF family protein [Bacteriovoracaceae bacterium]